MVPIPEDLRDRFEEYGQAHVFHWWERLEPAEQIALLNQLRDVDLELLKQLYEKRNATVSLPPLDRIEPISWIDIRPNQESDRVTRLGEEELRQGRVAVLLVAGGQGSRLGFEHPKGMFPIGPVSRKSLFQVHAERVIALQRRYGKPLPVLVMTSPVTHDETVAFSAKNGHFGLSKDLIFVMQQGTMPALDRETGKLLMAGPGELFLSPNGHGGVLKALVDYGYLEKLKDQGVKHLFYFQVDNPLVKIADPYFIGKHLEAMADVSSKAVAKTEPGERIGVFVKMDGKCMIIEYSDLPSELAQLRDEKRNLRFGAGSPAIHVFDIDFLRRVGREHGALPFHIARKRVPYFSPDGEYVVPDYENALKFEMFIFDILPLAERWTVVATDRQEEFAPLKNETGPDSPESVRQAISRLAANWLEQAGVRVPRDADGTPVYPLEVSPLFALDAAEFAAKIDRQRRIDGPTYWGPDASNSP
ncbi:MAG: UDP-N-acetylhexosamine pyrophosphorylase [Gemmatales bacterium]|nr:MAG: UDP-N-acetylhexosamine pyrophosphorylase [Gemmatales bacterium]